MTDRWSDIVGRHYASDGVVYKIVSWDQDRGFDLQAVSTNDRGRLSLEQAQVLCDGGSLPATPADFSVDGIADKFVSERAIGRTFHPRFWCESESRWVTRAVANRMGLR